MFSSDGDNLSNPADRPRFTRHFCQSHTPNGSGMLANRNVASRLIYDHDRSLHERLSALAKSNSTVPVFFSVVRRKYVCVWRLHLVPQSDQFDFIGVSKAVICTVVNFALRSLSCLLHTLTTTLPWL